VRDTPICAIAVRRLRVFHLALRCVVIPRAVACAADVQRVLSVADVDVAGATGGAAVAAEVEGEVAGRALGPLDGIESVITLTRPPIAFAPYSNVAGPRTTSIFRAAAGLVGTE
jgi:hypothetical protein